MQPALDATNKAILEQKSPVMLQNATVNYVAAVKGQSGTAHLSYKVDVNATIAGYVLPKETCNSSAIVDLDWRNFIVAVLVVINTECGPILDFGRFNLLMKSWHYLFDVTGLLKNYGVFRPGEGAAVPIHSVGESSFRKGTHLPKEVDATLQVAGAQVRMQASAPLPSGQI